MEHNVFHFVSSPISENDQSLVSNLRDELLGNLASTKLVLLNLSLGKLLK